MKIYEDELYVFNSLLVIGIKLIYDKTWDYHSVELTVLLPEFEKVDSMVSLSMKVDNLKRLCDTIVKKEIAEKFNDWIREALKKKEDGSLDIKQLNELLGALPLAYVMLFADVGDYDIDEETGEMNYIDFSVGIPIEKGEKAKGIDYHQANLDDLAIAVKFQAMYEGKDIGAVMSKINNLIDYEAKRRPTRGEIYHALVKVTENWKDNKEIDGVRERLLAITSYS